MMKYLQYIQRLLRLLRLLHCCIAITMLVGAASAQAASPNGAVIVQTPVSNARAVNPTVIFAPAATERSGTYLLYVAAWYANQWYFLSLQNFQMKVIPYSGGEIPVYQTANGAELYTDQPNGGFAAQTWYLGFGDLSTLSGLQLYTGFGRTAEDMLAKGQVQLVYSVP